MKIKFWPALSLRGKVITAIIVLQVAMIAVFVSVQTYHERLMVRDYIKDANIQFATNLAHAFSLPIRLGDMPLLQLCAEIAARQDDIKYVVVQSLDGEQLAGRFKDFAPSSLAANGKVDRLSNPALVRELERGGGWFSLFSPVTYEISVPVKVKRQEEIG